MCVVRMYFGRTDYIFMPRTDSLVLSLQLVVGICFLIVSVLGAVAWMIYSNFHADSTFGRVSLSTL